MAPTNVCLFGFEDNACVIDDHCSVGRCVEGRCRDDICVTDEDCIGNLFNRNRCIAGYCRGRSSDACSDASDCNSGLICPCGACVADYLASHSEHNLCNAPRSPEFAPCTDSGDCLSSVCRYGTCGTKHGCSSDDDCPESNRCDVIMGSGFCVSQNVGSPCTADSECSQGSCSASGVCIFQ